MIKRFNSFINESFDGKCLRYYAFDIDDSLLFLDTVIHMDKKVGDKWVPEDVSTEKFAIVRNDKVNWRISDNNPNNAFVEFRDIGKRGDNTFVEDFKKAVIAKKFAPSWKKFIECLVNGYVFAIVTSRGHKPDNVRRAIEWMIYDYGLDNFKNLDLQSIDHDESLEDQMINNLLSYHDLFGTDPGNVIEEYLNCCVIYTVSSPDFVKKFGDLPVEQAKKAALKDFTEIAYQYARKIGCKAKLGFSDDDPRFVTSAIDTFLDLNKWYKKKIEFSVFDTGGNKMKKTDIMSESSTPGLESSVMTCTQFGNMTGRLYPQGEDQRQDDFANQFKRQTKYLTNMSKDIVKKKRRIKKSKKINEEFIFGKHKRKKILNIFSVEKSIKDCLYDLSDNSISHNFEIIEDRYLYCEFELSIEKKQLDDYLKEIKDRVKDIDRNIRFIIVFNIPNVGISLLFTYDKLVSEYHIKSLFFFK